MLSRRYMFDTAQFSSALSTASVGRAVLYRQTVDTTMVLARQAADAGAAHGTLCLAEEQTAGRGRRGRSFFSPGAENLYFTLILRLPMDVHRLLPISVPLAVCEAIAAEGVAARIKWPNDIWIGDRKICGMLIDAEVSADATLAMPGIGINVNGDPAQNPELRLTATSIARELGRPVSRELLLARICNRLEAVITLPAAAVVENYRALSLVMGRSIVVHPAVGEPFEAMATAIEEDGSLRITRSNGSSETVLAADVSVRPA